MPPEGRHEENVPRSEHAVGPPGPREQGELLQVGGADIHGRHHHGRALQQRFPSELLGGEVDAEESLGDVPLVEILVVVGFKEREMLFSRNLKFRQKLGFNVWKLKFQAQFGQSSTSFVC